MRTADSAIKYFGDTLRHPLSLEHSITFNPSGSLRTISARFRRGVPHANWPELALAEGQFKDLQRRDSPPAPGQLSHPF